VERFRTYKRNSSKLWLTHSPEAHVRASIIEQLEILLVLRQCILSLMKFIFNNHEIFQTNSSISNINTSNRHHLHRPNANLPFFFKQSTFYASKNIFISSPPNVTILRNDKPQFTAAVKNTYKHTAFILYLNFLYKNCKYYIK